MLHLSHVILSYHSTLLLFIIKHALALDDIKEIQKRENYEVDELHVLFTVLIHRRVDLVFSLNNFTIFTFSIQDWH
jgi:hypothetical protein